MQWPATVTEDDYMNDIMYNLPNVKFVMTMKEEWGAASKTRVSSSHAAQWIFFNFLTMPWMAHVESMESGS